jgi:putative ABC transport system permease protein
MMQAETLRSSLYALRANKFRTFLTALGLVIGNASVILVVTISLTSRDYILEQIQRIGSNLIYAQYEAGNNPSMGTGQRRLHQDRRHRCRARTTGLAHRRCHRRDEQLRPHPHPGSRRRRGHHRHGSLLPDGPKSRPAGGPILDQDDVERRNHVALLMERLARRLYGSQEAAVGQVVKLHDLQFTVIGTFQEKT